MGSDVIVHNAGGRNRTIGKKGLALLEKMAADGNSQTSMAKALRMDRSTLAEIKKRQPEVEEAIERGYSQMEDELVDGLMARFRRGILDPKDKGAITAVLFLLKSRRGYEGTRIPSHITINQDNRQQTIAFPSAQDMDTYMRRVADGTPVSVPS